ncbi:cell wall-binding repeat-containing protein [Euzebya rosea]|uniref:cell wall-binding repeat-containing protein n=1 Tax=Euzebya rosea TaxID=2052804 RepID=UPI000D3E438C|nr:cell wall-binding repeat-containing protein [Euzebya rosea]
MTITKTGRRVAFLGLLALVVAILPLTAASAQDATYIDFDINEDFEASDALQTSILASQQAFPDGADTVLLTTSEDGADALVSGVLANDAALLYYNTDEGVVDAHVDEITRLGATDVIIIGGTERISEDVADALEGMGLTVTRLAGDERITTANEVLEYAEANRDDFNETASHLSRAFGTEDNSQTAFADAVGLGAWDAQGGAGTVLAPSDAEVLSPEYPTTQYFTDVNPENETIVPIGGVAAVPAEVVDYLTGEPAEQTAGDRVENEEANNRAGTAVAINEARGLDASDLDGVVVVDAFADNFFIDAYATSALAGNNNYAVIVSNGDELSPESAEWLGSPRVRPERRHHLRVLHAEDLRSGVCPDRDRHRWRPRGHRDRLPRLRARGVR